LLPLTGCCGWLLLAALCLVLVQLLIEGIRTMRAYLCKKTKTGCRQLLELRAATTQKSQKA